MVNRSGRAMSYSRKPLRIIFLNARTEPKHLELGKISNIVKLDKDIPNMEDFNKKYGYLN